MLTESHDEEQIIARVAALDIGKAEVVCCVRVPAGAEAKKRLQEVSTHSTMTRALTELANHLVDLGVERVVMEATSVRVGKSPSSRFIRLALSSLCYDVRARGDEFATPSPLCRSQLTQLRH